MPTIIGKKLPTPPVGGTVKQKYPTSGPVKPPPPLGKVPKNKVTK